MILLNHWSHICPAGNRMTQLTLQKIDQFVVLHKISSLFMWLLLDKMQFEFRRSPISLKRIKSFSSLHVLSLWPRSPWRSRVPSPCSFDMAHHLAHWLFQRLNGQINHVTDRSREMNGWSIIRLRPNLSALGEQKPGAPQPPSVCQIVCLCGSC